MAASKTSKARSSGSRKYRSALREEQSAQTRERILEALVRVMARNGIADISIPLVAREANVSVPSVYRYFPTKRELIDALQTYALSKGSFTFADFGKKIETPEDLADIIPAVFKKRESIEPTLSAAMTSRLGYEIRRTEFEQRAQLLHEILKPAAEKLGRREAGWLTDVVLVLNSFAAVRAFKDYLGLNTDEAAKRVAWTIRMLSRAAQAGSEKAGSEEPQE
jgi:AcrR family transcriptional regulator